MAEADLVLYDLKGLNRETHILGTGVSNEIILKNLAFRDSLEKEIIIRLSLIPGYTDSRENMESTAALIAGLKSVKRVDLIPFYNCAKVKYRQLGWPLPKVFEENFSKEQEEPVLELFQSYGLPAQIGGGSKTR